MSDPPLLWHSSDVWPAELGDPLPLLGAKALSLRRMATSGLNVPPSFTLTTRCGRDFFDDPADWSKRSMPLLDNAIVRLETSLGKRLGDASRPLVLAVRSGAAASMPGLMKTVLNIGHASISSAGRDEWMRRLVEAIGEVFASWNSPAAVAYRQAKGIDVALGTAVTIQEMVPAEISGVLFTCDPRSPHSGTMIVEAVAGMGEGLVSGEITPRRWVVSRDDRHVVVSPAETSTGQLSAPDAGEFVGKHLRDLCEQSLRLSAEWLCDLDVEWAVTGDTLYFLQARPVQRIASTTRESNESTRHHIVESLKSAANGSPRCWVRHNLGDSLPHPTPLTWDVLSRLMNGSGGLGELYRRLGFTPSEKCCRDGFLELVGGQIYADPERLREMYGAGYPLSFDLAKVRARPDWLERGPTRLSLEDADPFLLLRMPAILATGVRVAWRQRKLVREAARSFDESTAPLVQSVVQSEGARELSGLSSDELAIVILERVTLVNRFLPDLLLPGTLGAAAAQELAALLNDLLGGRAGEELLAKLLQLVPDDVADRQMRLMAGVSEAEGLTAFLAEFGHRGPQEMELAAPRWSEQSARIPAFKNSGQPVPVPAAELEQAYGKMRNALAAAGVGSLAGKCERTLGTVFRLLPYRERGRHLFLKLYGLVRQAIETLARNTGLGGEIYYLTQGELSRLGEAASRDSLHQIAQAREQEWRELQAVTLPDFIDSQHLEELLADTQRGSTSGQLLQGQPLAGGRARGQVLVICRDNSDLSVVGRVVVRSKLDPGELPMLAGAAAIVVERGGMLSHGAVLARQLGIPAVMLPRACAMLCDGVSANVDGFQGTVLVEEPSA